MSQFTPRKIAALLATAGLALSMVGVGLSATFSDSGVVSQSVSVGTFAIELDSTASNAVVSTDKKSITFAAPAITHSGASSAPMPFTVKNVGSIGLAVTISADLTGASPRFSAVALNGAENFIAPGASLDFVGGLSWTELTNDDLGRAVTVTYTISAQG